MQHDLAALATVAARDVTRERRCFCAASALRPSLFSSCIVSAVITYLLVQPVIAVPISNPTKQCAPNEAALITASVHGLVQHHLHRRDWNYTTHAIVWGSIFGALLWGFLIWMCVLFCASEYAERTWRREHQRSRTGADEEPAMVLARGMARGMARQLQLNRHRERTRDTDRASSRNIDVSEMRRSRDLGPGSSGIATLPEPVAPRSPEPTRPARPQLLARPNPPPAPVSVAPGSLEPRTPTQPQPAASRKPPPAYANDDPAPAYVRTPGNADQSLRQDAAGLQMPEVAFTRST